MVIAGIVIVVATFIAIIKQFETRLVLLLSGLLMCFIGGQIGAGTTAFVKELTNPGLVPTICTVLGFSYVMEYTKCTEHMVYFISAGLKKMTKNHHPWCCYYYVLDQYCVTYSGRLCSCSRCSINSCTYSLRCASSNGRLCYFLRDLG